MVKWPAGEAPLIDWDGFDSLVGAWLSGDAFPDHIGLNFWPMPEAVMLDRYDPSSRLQYWSQASLHFDANGWLSRSAIALHGPTGRWSNANEAADLSSDAADILKCHPRVRVLLPLEDREVQLLSTDVPAGIERATASRLLTAAPTLVYTAGSRNWGEQTLRHWLRTDLPGLVPYQGAGGNEFDAQVWAWLAYLRHLDSYGVSHVFESNYILWNSTLPLGNSPDSVAEPGELVWFYPGEWFGVDMPLPTLQLKWLRQAEQDYEYLLMAQDRGEQITALQLARLIAKPVELDAGQTPDPLYPLLTGTIDRTTWSDAKRLLARTILLHKPGQKVDEALQRDLEIETLQLSQTA